ncbi:MAG: 4Fe-4S dicluster domain-containing protein [Desulfobacteraceae bacterium]|nr:4Fe-4S dicluster domain-containing protein [Desulfobacteraceae bacterium]
MGLFKVNDNCNGCLACEQNCPASALNHFDQDNKRKIMHNISLCARCGHCWRLCPQDAIEFKELISGKWDLVTALDLLHCEVCGEPVFTPKLSKDVSKSMNNEVRVLCPDHKGAKPAGVWKKLAPKRVSQ